MKLTIPFGLAFVISMQAWAADPAAVHEATVTDINGTVTLFSHPSQDEQGPPPHALFNGMVYSVQPVKQGDRIANGNILRTAPGSKVRVIYPNGDQFYVGSQTAYKISWNDADPTGKVNVDLGYGGLRGVVQKGGPLKHLIIHTRSATMGVRGTDFYIGEEPTGALKVEVLRGQVEVKSDAPKAAPVPVAAGFSAQLAAPPEPSHTVQASAETHAPISAPIVRKTSKEELRDLESDAVFRAPAQAAEAPAPEIQVLQKKAFETTLQDIKVADPKTYAQLKSSGAKSVDDLNRGVVEKEAAVAPSMPETARQKPTEQERRRQEELRRKLEERDFNGAQ